MAFSRSFLHGIFIRSSSFSKFIVFRCAAGAARRTWGRTGFPRGSFRRSIIEDTAFRHDSTRKRNRRQRKSAANRAAHPEGCAAERVKKVFLTRSQTRPTSLGSRLKGLRLAAAHSLTLARLRAEKYFCRRTRRRQKCFALYLRLRAQTLRGFFDSRCPPHSIGMRRTILFKKTLRQEKRSSPALRAASRLRRPAARSRRR